MLARVRRVGRAPSLLPSSIGRYRVVRKIGEEHQIADAAMPALWRSGPGDFDITNVQTHTPAFVVYIRRVHRDPGRDYNAPNKSSSGR